MKAEEQPVLSVDDAFAFVSRLRGDPAKMNDAGGDRQPSDAPWPVKVYDGGDRIPLAGADPWWMPVPAAGESDFTLQLGRLLFHAVGGSRVRWQPGGTMLSSPQHPELVWPESRLSLRRPIPSGGAMYPTEVYVVTTTATLHCPSVFHYDAGRHELLDLAHPCPAAALRRALKLPEDALLRPLALVLTHRYCKNLHKYRNFAYRLGAVDVGVALGRLLSCGAKAFGGAEVQVDFDDRALNTMCGLTGLDESAYAVILLGPPLAVPPTGCCQQAIPSPPSVLERGTPARPSPVFAAMHAAACQSPPPSAGQGARLVPDAEAQAAGEKDRREHPTWLPAPLPAGIEERKALLCRTSNGAWFTGAALDANLLAAVLHHTNQAVMLLHQVCRGTNLPRVRLYCAVERVDGMWPGWYRYEPSQHALYLVGAGRANSTAAELQRALYAATVDLERSAFSLHVATVLDFRSDPRGARAYRVQQLYVGTAVEAATRWSTALGAGSHPLHGFDAQRVDQLYGLSGGPYGVQAQVTIGVARPAGTLEGSVIA